jgi:predicted DNA-binding protein
MTNQTEKHWRYRRSQALFVNTTMRLSAHTITRLRKLAAKHHRPQAHFTREALKIGLEYLEQLTPPPRK